MRQHALSLAALLVGCGSQPPSFVEKQQVSLNFSVQSDDVVVENAPQSPLPNSSEIDAVLADLDAEASISDGAASGDATASKPDNPSSTPDEPTSSNKGGTSQGGNTGAGDRDDMVSPDFSRPSAVEQKACARLAGVDEKRLVVAGSKQDVLLNPTNVIVAKIVGNQNRLVLNLKGDGETSLAGICLFLAGNQASVEVQTTMPVSRLLYTARGNQSNGMITASEGGDVRDMVVDMSGHGGVATVSGVKSCPQPKLKGSGAVFNCTVR